MVMNTPIAITERVPRVVKAARHMVRHEIPFPLSKFGERLTVLRMFSSVERSLRFSHTLTLFALTMHFFIVSHMVSCLK